MGWEPATSRDRSSDEVTCVRCLDEHDVMDLDRLLWCDRCRHVARNRASWYGWLGGLLLGAGVALYIWIVMRPTDLVIGGWVATVVAAVWIGKKIAREIVYGAMRSRNVPATEAIPPTTAGDQGST